MRRSAPTAAIVLALAVALVAARPGLAQQRGPSSGSAVPCAVPMRWTLSEIDGRFGLTRQEALAAARQAVAMWEESVGGDLFRFADDGSGSPVTFEYDDRQAAVEAGMRRRAELDEARRSVEGRRARIEGVSARLDSARTAYEQEAQEHRRAMERYNADVARWNEQGGAPPEVRAELEDRLAVLERRREGLRAREADLRELSDEIRADVRAFNDEIAALAEREERLVRDFPLVATESGRYDEVVRRQDGRILSVERRIRVFQYTNRHDLALVLAHELGHALGLGHAGRPGNVMSEVMATGDGTSPSAGVTGGDIAMLRARCPSLGAASGDQSFF